MPSDALLTLATANTAVSTTTAPTSLGVGPNAQTTFDLKTVVGVGKNHPLTAYVLYDAASTSSGTGTALFTIEHADDNGSGSPASWQILHASDQGPISLTTTASTGQCWITIARSKRYIRLNALLAGTGATVTIAQAVVRESEP